MPTIRRPGSAPSDPHAASAAPESAAPAEHSLSHLEVPADTTPTWELEMLVSGAVLVGLFQLPPVVDGVLRHELPRFGTTLAVLLAGFGYFAVKGMVYALTVTFVVHAASRAYWVALVGLDSVFPRGVRWENARRYGPIMQEIVRERVPGLPRVISSLDNFCSVLFAGGFLTVFLATTVLGLMLVAGGAAWGTSALFFGGAHANDIFAVLIWLLILPVLLIRLERYVAPRLDPAGKSAAVFRALVRYNYMTVGLRLFGPILLTLTTNVRRRVALPLIFTLLFGSVAVAVSDWRGLRTASAAGAFPELPATLARRANDFRHYADQRSGEGAFAQVPFIQSDVVRDPYVRLFIPYLVRRDGVELSACMRRDGGVAAQGSAELATRCLAAIHAVSVNGAGRAALDFRFYTDASSGLQGLLVYVPVEGLAHGRNLLVVRQPPQPDERGVLRPVPADSIPFWL